MEETKDIGISITIKCPALVSPVGGDYKLNLQGGASVYDLRRSLSESHPCRPQEDDIRLVYRGRILNNDSLILKDVYNLSLASMQSAGAGGDTNAMNLPLEMVIHMVLRSGDYQVTSESQESIAFRNKVEKSPIGNGLSSLLRPPTAVASSTEEDEAAGKEPIEAIPFAERLPALSLRKSLTPSQSSLPSIRRVGSSGSFCRGSNGTLYYAQVESTGQIIYTDLSKAIVSDGSSYYRIRTPNPNALVSLPAVDIPSTFKTPPVLSANTSPDLAVQNAIRNLNLPDGAQVRLIEVDLGAVISFLLRIALAILILAPGANRTRLLVVSVMFLFSFLIQSGMLTFLRISNAVDRAWKAIMDSRRRFHNVEGTVDEVPAAALGQHRNDVGIAEVMTTFFLSIFPTDIPRHATPAPAPNGVQPEGDQQNNVVAAGEDPVPQLDPVPAAQLGQGAEIVLN